jgi:cytochrome P450
MRVDEAMTPGFDHHSVEYARDSRRLLRELRETCPVTWSEANGGYWVVTTHADVERIARDTETFSSDHDLYGERRGYKGITIPETGSFRRNPVEIDPPEVLKYRHLLNPYFAPSAIAQRLPQIERWTTACLDRVIESGEFDVVLDLANPVPALFTAAFLGIALTDWENWSWPQHQLNFAPPGSAESDEAKRLMTENQHRLEERIAERRSEASDDLISALLAAQIDGRGLTDREVVEMCMTLISGGFVTTTALTAHALYWLSEHPEMKDWLLEDEARLPVATEEFIRWSSPAQALARTVTRDIELHGQQLREGDRVLVSWASANQDVTVFEHADDVDLQRQPNRHAAFGFGIHRCIGNSFARAEFGIMVREVLSRMPDYTVDVERTQRFPSIGVINGFISMPATFTPGVRVGDDADVVTPARRWQRSSGG